MRITAQKEKEGGFVLLASSHPLDQHQEGTSQIQELPSPGKEGPGECPASPVSWGPTL